AVYLAEIQRWRVAVVTAALGKGVSLDHVEHLTPRARRRLVTLLDTKWDPQTRLWAIASGFDVTPFPATRHTTQIHDPMQDVIDVLHWRAGILDYLTDGWDSLSKPELEMNECAAIGSFIRPARLEGRCVYCLTEYEPRRIDPEEHGCVMARHQRAG